MGAVTPLANGMQASWERLLEGKCGIRRLHPCSQPEAGHVKVTLLRAEFSFMDFIRDRRFKLNEQAQLTTLVPCFQVVGAKCEAAC